MTTYHYVIVRYIHSRPADEAVNVGIVMWLPEQQQLLYSLHERSSRLARFFTDIDGHLFRRMVRDFGSLLGRIKRDVDGHAQLRMLSAPAMSIEAIVATIFGDDESCFQPSSIMAGIADNPAARLRALMKEFVEKHDRGEVARPRRGEIEIWYTVEEAISREGLDEALEENVVIVGEQDYDYEFKRGWRNGVDQVIEPITFDYLDGAQILDKANTWIGRLTTLRKGGRDFRLTAVVAPPAMPRLMDHYQRAEHLLSSAPGVRTIAHENEMARVMALIRSDLRAQA